MCRAKCAAITVQENIMGFSLVMDAQDFSNARFDDPEIMCAKRKPKVNVSSTKRIAINVALVVSENVSKSE